jgi:predicted O-linked N-acetylglucosamine transferase (SPINDLY family)
LVAASESDYVRKAVDLGFNLPLLTRLRTYLRQEAKIHLGNGERLAREISEAYRMMWDRYREESDHIVPAMSKADERSPL